jgi:adenylate kinase
MMGGRPSKRVVLLGGPGSGKGTLGHSLARRLGVPLISTGDMLRQAARRETELGREVKTHVDGGTLVPDGVIAEVVDHRLSEKDCRLGFVLDGFPRTMVQAQALDRILVRQGARLGAVLLLTVGMDVAVQRNLDRLSCVVCGAVYNRSSSPPRREGFCDVCGGVLHARADDCRNTIAARWDDYRRLTEPLVAYFQQRGMLHTLEGAKPAGEVLEDAWSAIGGNGTRDDPSAAP